MRKALRASTVACLFLLGLFGCKESPSVSDVAKALPDGVAWDTFEDAFLKLSHPKDRRVLPVKLPTSRYFVLGPNDAADSPGLEAISIVPKFKNIDGQNLREVVAEDIKSSSHEGWRLLAKVQDSLLPGGRCQSYLLEGVTGSPCVASDSKRATCIQRISRSECLADSGVPVSIWTLTEAYPEAGKPSPRAREQIQVFERLLKSIEFKK